MAAVSPPGSTCEGMGNGRRLGEGNHAAEMGQTAQWRAPGYRVTGPCLGEKNRGGGRCERRRAWRLRRRREGVCISVVLHAGEVRPRGRALSTSRPAARIHVNGAENSFPTGRHGGRERRGRARGSRPIGAPPGGRELVVGDRDATFGSYARPHPSGPLLARSPARCCLRETLEHIRTFSLTPCSRQSPRRGREPRICQRKGAHVARTGDPRTRPVRATLRRGIL